MMREIASTLRARGVDFDSRERRIMCFAHIVHIAVTHMSKVLSGSHVPTSGAADDDTEQEAEDANVDNLEQMSKEDAATDRSFKPAPRPGDVTAQTYEEARARNPLQLLRGLIKAIRVSGQRREAFRACIENGNEMNLFTDDQVPPNTIKVPVLELLRDVPTRWDSIYLMIARARLLRPVSTLDFRLPHSH